MKRFLNFWLLAIMLAVFISPVFADRSLTGWLYDLPGQKLFFDDSSPYQSYLARHSTYTGCLEIATATIGCRIINDIWENLPAKSTMSMCTVDVDSATCTLNKYYLRVGDFTQPNADRCLRVSFSSNVAATIFRGNVDIQGLDARGIMAYETVISSNDTLNRYSNNAFSYVYGATISIVQANIQAVEFNMGSGDKIGLSADIRRSVDLLVITESYVNKELSTYTIDTTYNTVTPTNVPNSSIDYRWKFIGDLEKTRY